MIKAIIKKPSFLPRYTLIDPSVKSLKNILECEDLGQSVIEVKDLSLGNYHKVYAVWDDKGMIKGKPMSCTVLQDLLNIDTVFGTCLFFSVQDRKIVDVPVTLEELNASKLVYWEDLK